MSAKIDTSLFNQPSLTESITIVDCTLSNGSSTQCYQIKVFANDVKDDGLYCPSTIYNIVGMGIYEPGSAVTNVGLSVIGANLLNLIENDGFNNNKNQTNLIRVQLGGKENPHKKFLASKNNFQTIFEQVKLK